MHAERSVWVTHECEPSLWMLLIAQRSWFSGPVRDEALRETLKQLHAVCTLLNGPLQRLLDQVYPSHSDRNAEYLLRYQPSPEEAYKLSPKEAYKETNKHKNKPDWMLAAGLEWEAGSKGAGGTVGTVGGAPRQQQGRPLPGSPQSPEWPRSRAVAAAIQTPIHRCLSRRLCVNHHALLSSTNAFCTQQSLLKVELRQV